MQERNSSGTPTVSYTRGSDLSGSLEGAGGIGGLLGRSHGYSSGNWSTHSYYHADGNGNITYLLNAGESMVASYKYDAYGNTLTSSGSLAGANNYRFSSKERIPVTDIYGSELYYYGYRFYQPSLHRWLSRDPISELGGRNLYGFVYNNPVGRIDRLGLFVERCPGSLEAIAARCACKAAGAGKAGSAGGPLAAIICVAGAVAAELVAIDVALAIEVAALEKQNEEDARRIEEQKRELDNLRARCRQPVPPELANHGNDVEKLCAMWRWELQRNKDCIAMQIAYSKKWYNGPDERHWQKIRELERANEKLEDKIKRLCKPCPESGGVKHSVGKP